MPGFSISMYSRGRVSNLLAQAPTAPKPCRRSRLSRGLRTLHVSLGIVFTLNFLLIVTSGFLVQHREAFHLSDRTVSRKWLPAGYRPLDPGTEVRADIVITDLHSGRIFGGYGIALIDGSTVAWLFMIASGYAMQILMRLRSGTNTTGAESR